MPHHSNDEHFMQIALKLGDRNSGRTYPNPSVGCIIVNNNQIVGMGATAVSGRPHAEQIALQRAGNDANGATAFVTLEPCYHRCTPALISAGIRRVVMTITDPDTRTAGAGIATLRQNGIDVTTDVMKTQATESHRGFLSRITRNRPVIDIKMAMSMDGRIAMHNGDSQWITGEKSRNFVHLLRAKYNAILTSTTTVVKDCAKLDCRLPGYSNPTRIIIGNANKLSPDLPIFKINSPIWLITKNTIFNNIKPLFAKIITLSPDQSLHDACNAIADNGINSVMVEAGSQMITNLFNSNLIDRFHLFYAPIILGNQGIPFLGDLKNTLTEYENGQSPLQQHRMTLIEKRQFDDDWYCLVGK